MSTSVPDYYFDEFVIALIVVGTQLGAFLTTCRAAQRLRSLFPEESSDLTMTAGELTVPPVEGQMSPGQRRRVEIYRFSMSGPLSIQTETLIEQTNRVLAASGTTVSPSEIIAGVARRVAERFEHQAMATANVPLFVGLMGTFAGVITGLIQISLQTGITERTVRLLLGGILVAMVGSLSGVLFMVIANAIVLPRARRMSDVRMDAYLLSAHERLRDWVARTAVAPRDPSQFPAASLEALATFNRDFSGQVGHFREAIDRLGQTVEQQRASISALNTLDLGGIIQFNLQLLASAQTFLDRFGALGDVAQRLTTASTSAGDLLERVGKLVDRIARFEESVNALGQRIALDHTVTGQTVVLIKAQLDAITARTDLVKQYVTLEDERVQTLVSDHRDQIKNLTARAAQTIDRVGQEIAAEVARATEPVKVQSVMEHIASLPVLAGAATRAAEEGLTELRLARASHDALLQELRRFTAAVALASPRGFWASVVRAIRRRFGRAQEMQRV